MLVKSLGSVYVYDSMNKEDKVMGFTGSKSLTADVYSDGKTPKDKISRLSLKEIPKMAEKAGSLAASSFLSNWIHSSKIPILIEISYRSL